jgi:hypothetical protein
LRYPQIRMLRYPKVNSKHITENTLFTLVMLHWPQKGKYCNCVILLASAYSHTELTKIIIRHRKYWIPHVRIIFIKINRNMN